MLASPLSSRLVAIAVSRFFSVDSDWLVLARLLAVTLFHFSIVSPQGSPPGVVSWLFFLCVDRRRLSF